jgi:hypothetical protein
MLFSRKPESALRIVNRIKNNAVFRQTGIKVKHFFATPLVAYLKMLI